MEINKLSDDELKQRAKSMRASQGVRNARLQQKRKRHEKIDFTNERFDNLLNEIEIEIEKRGLDV